MFPSSLSSCNLVVAGGAPQRPRVARVYGAPLSWPGPLGCRQRRPRPAADPHQPPAGLWPAKFSIVCVLFISVSSRHHCNSRNPWSLVIDAALYSKRAKISRLPLRDAPTTAAAASGPTRRLTHTITAVAAAVAAAKTLRLPVGLEAPASSPATPVAILWRKSAHLAPREPNSIDHQ